MAKRPAYIKAKLQQAEIEIQHYVLALEKQVAKLVKKNVDLEIKYMAYKRKFALTSKAQHHANIVISENHGQPPSD